MTDIEELVRESLRTAPPVTPSTTDPVAAVSSRVRRARARWAGGAVAVVAVLAAIVVPLSLRDADARRLVPTTPARGISVWDKNAVAVTAGDGYLWELRRDPSSSDGSGFLVKLDLRTHTRVSQWGVRAPFDFMAFGLGHVWVWGGGDGGYPDGLVQTFDASSRDGCPCDSTGNAGHGFGGVAFQGTHAWVTTGRAIWEMTSDATEVVWHHVFPAGSSPSRIVVAGGQLVVQTSPTSLQWLIPAPSGVGARLGNAGAVVDGTEQILGADGADWLLVSTGTDVERWHASGDDTGDDVIFNSGVGAVTALPSGDVVVGTLGTEDASLKPALWLAKANPDGSLCARCVAKIVDDVSVLSLTVNPAGGVDYVLDDGTAAHWQP